MKYEEARLSGKPFNRKKYQDGWYLYDRRRKIDFALYDETLRIWSERDIQAEDWHTLQEDKNRKYDS